MKKCFLLLAVMALAGGTSAHAAILSQPVITGVCTCGADTISTDSTDASQTTWTRYVTPECLEGLIRWKTKVYLRNRKKKGIKVPEEEARAIVEKDAHAHFIIMPQDTIDTRREELYQELKKNAKESGMHFSDRRLRKAANKWDPSEVPTLYMEMAGLKRHTGESITRSLVRSKMFWKSVDRFF